MLYNINKIARIVGITSESIRLYEKKGVLKSRKNPENNYRNYGPLDIGTILRCRSYAQYGFSVSEAAELINDCSLSTAHKRLVGQELYLRHEIERNQRILSRLQELNELIALIKEHPDLVGTCHLTLHPGMFRMDYHRNGVLIEEPDVLELLPAWSNMVPLSFVSVHVPLENLMEQKQDYYVGLGILEEDAAFLKVQAGGPVSFYPSELAIYCILAVPGEDEIKISSLSPLLDYASQHDLTPISDAFSRMIITVYRNKSEFIRYYQVWLPVK